MFGKTVQLFPEHFKCLLPLLGTTEETNFFLNVHHIQLHRKIRAVVKLGECLDLSTTLISGVFIPLLNHFLFDVGCDPNLSHYSVLTLGFCQKS